MMTPEQRDSWFGYHAPTTETKPKYAKIRAAELRTAADIDDALGNFAGAEAFGRINAACLAFADVIDAQAPDSADKSAAIRCVRLARNAANEAVVADAEHAADMRVICAQELVKARWRANGAIAGACQRLISVRAD